MAHSGMNRTVARLQLAWYCHGMVAEVSRLLKTCELCQMAKPEGNKPPSSRQRFYASRPWHKVAIDLVGPMPMTIGGNQWILVFSDHFTRWQVAIPLADVTAPRSSHCPQRKDLLLFWFATATPFRSWKTVSVPTDGRVMQPRASRSDTHHPLSPPARPTE